MSKKAIANEEYLYIYIYSITSLAHLIRGPNLILGTNLILGPNLILVLNLILGPNLILWPTTSFFIATFVESVGFVYYVGGLLGTF